MTKEIETGLFLRLMQMTAPARKDILEYIGQGPVSAERLRAAMSAHEVRAADKAEGDRISRAG